MSSIKWKDGLVHSPDGFARQIPEEVYWASGLFITRDGCCRRRYWDCVLHLWKWEEEAKEVDVNEMGTIGFHIQDMGFVSMQRAICLAHRHRHPDSKNRVYCRSDELRSSTVNWDLEESNKEECVM